MDKLPTYLDLKYRKPSRIFEAEEVQGLSESAILEAERKYEEIAEKLMKGEEISEGFLSGLIGGGAAALVGPSIMKAVCKALGIDEKGPLGKLLTSRLVAASVGYALGK